ncbi:hypothetical protein, partial [Streptomyces sp. NPDC092307]|uniref:hypothetical protein n=1 Tax=Streptomyces sp. NPDC092307 TaxID=3366013 RepID=UPI00380D820E
YFEENHPYPEVGEDSYTAELFFGEEPDEFGSPDGSHTWYREDLTLTATELESNGGGEAEYKLLATGVKCGQEVTFAYSDGHDSDIVPPGPGNSGACIVRPFPPGDTVVTATQGDRSDTTTVSVFPNIPVLILHAQHPNDSEMWNKYRAEVKDVESGRAVSVDFGEGETPLTAIFDEGTSSYWTGSYDYSKSGGHTAEATLSYREEPQKVQTGVSVGASANLDSPARYGAYFTIAGPQYNQHSGYRFIHSMRIDGSDWPLDGSAIAHSDEGMFVAIPGSVVGESGIQLFHCTPAGRWSPLESVLTSSNIMNVAVAWKAGTLWALYKTDTGKEFIAEIYPTVGNSIEFDDPTFPDARSALAVFDDVLYSLTPASPPFPTENPAWALLRKHNPDGAPSLETIYLKVGPDLSYLSQVVRTGLSTRNGQLCISAVARSESDDVRTWCSTVGTMTEGLDSLSPRGPVWDISASSLGDIQAEAYNERPGAQYALSWIVNDNFGGFEYFIFNGTFLISFDEVTGDVVILFGGRPQ